MIFLAGLTILEKVRCLGRLSGWGADPVVALHLRNAADSSLPSFGPHGTKLGHSWYQWIIKVIFLAGLTILKKVRCLGIVGGWGVDPVVALHLRNATDYRIPTFGPHGIKLGHSWYQWIKKKWLSWLFWQFWKRRGVWADWVDGGLIPWLHSILRNTADYRIPTYGPHGTKLGHSWYQWIIKVIFHAGLTILKKMRCLGRLSGLGGWSRGCTPPKECCRLPPTYFWTTWHQTRAFLISVINKKWFFWLVWQF